MKYSPDIALKIVNLRSEGRHTIEGICKQVGINKDTYHDWKHTKPDFSDSIKKAEERANECKKEIVMSSFIKLIEGYDYEETHTEIVPSKTDPTDRTKAIVKSRKIIKKHMAPSPGAVIFAMKNYFPDTFKDRFEVDTPLSFEQAYELKYGKPFKANGVESGQGTVSA